MTIILFFLSLYLCCLNNLFIFTRPLLSFFNTTSVHCPNNLIDVSLKKLFQCMSIGMFSYKNACFLSFVVSPCRFCCGTRDVGGFFYTIRIFPASIHSFVRQNSIWYGWYSGRLLARNAVGPSLNLGDKFSFFSWCFLRGRRELSSGHFIVYREWE